MSGGSFDYLYSKSIDELVNNPWAIKEMAEALIREGFLDAGHATLGFHLYILAMRNVAEKIQEELEQIWRDMEWWKSGDSGRDRVEEAVRKWMQKHKAEHNEI